MSNLIDVRDGVAMVSSLDLADRFSKRHADVLRIIQGLAISKDFTQRNFALSEYADTTGRKLPMYWMTRDGWSILVMGFTGREAMEWKEKYLAAFNALEKANQSRALVVPSDMQGLMQIVKTFVEEQVTPAEADREAERIRADGERARADAAAAAAEAANADAMEEKNARLAAERTSNDCLLLVDALAKHAYRVKKELEEKVGRSHKQNDLMAQPAPTMTQNVLPMLPLHKRTEP